MSERKTLKYEEYLSETCKLRQPSPIRAILPLVKLPGMISFGGGMPNASTFPFSSMSFTLKDGAQIALSEEETNTALQYAPSQALPEFGSQLMKMQLEYHSPPRETADNLSLSVSTGSQDGLSKAFEMLLNKDDSLLLEDVTYSGSLSCLFAIQCKLVGVKTDEFGLIPEILENTLVNWDKKTMGKKPKVLYTIPTGANPSGGSLTLERKQKIYKLAQEHNLIIVEDDPYYFLQFTSPRTPSFLSMDIDGRVLRFDSMSKILSAGMRIGYATGPKELIDKMTLHTQATNLHSCGIAQGFASALLNYWKLNLPSVPAQDHAYNSGVELSTLTFPGFEVHVRNVASFYLSQKTAFISMLEKHLTGLAEWNNPTAGMFVWIKLLGIQDSSALIRERAVDRRVLLVPGTAFLPQGGPTPYVRASFSLASLEQMDTGLSRLAELLRQEKSC